MKQIQVKITQEWEWLIIDNRAVKLVTSTSQSCYCFQLSSSGHRTGAACSKTAAEQSVSLPAARLLLCGPTGCSSRDSRACTRQSNRLQSIRRYQGHVYVAKYAAIWGGELPAALWQSRLHSISTGDNRTLIVWDNKSHRECANAIGWAHLTYAQQSDIWQLVTFLPQMLKGFVSLQCVVQIQHIVSPFSEGQRECQQRSPPPSGTADFQCCECFSLRCVGFLFPKP